MIDNFISPFLIAKMMYNMTKIQHKNSINFNAFILRMIILSYVKVYIFMISSSRSIIWYIEWPHMETLENRLLFGHLMTTGSIDHTDGLYIHDQLTEIYQMIYSMTSLCQLWWFDHFRSFWSFADHSVDWAQSWAIYSWLAHRDLSDDI